MTSILLAKPVDVDRLITLLAWLSIVENPVEHDRYWQRIARHRREYPELPEIGQADPRVETRVMELRAELETDERVGEYDDVAENRMGYR